MVKSMTSKEKNFQYFLYGSIGGYIGQFVGDFMKESLYDIPLDPNPDSPKYISAVIAGGFVGIIIENTHLLNGVIAAVIISRGVSSMIDGLFCQEEDDDRFSLYSILIDILITYYLIVIFKKIVKSINGNRFSEGDIIISEEIIIKAAIIIFCKQLFETRKKRVTEKDKI